MAFAGLPVKFFAPLAAKGQRVYLQILLHLFKETQENLGLVNRDILMAFALESMRDSANFSETNEIEDEEPAFGADPESDPPSVLQRARAGAILRYLENCGWYVTEMQSDFRQLFFIPDYSFRILKVLHELSDNQSVSLQNKT